MSGSEARRVGTGHPQRSGPDGQKNAIELRRRVQLLYFEKGYSKTRIAAELGVSKGFVVKWTDPTVLDLTRDGRGWPRGRGRRWDEETRRRICELHEELERDPRAFYSGASAIAQRYRQRYPDEEVPPLRTIGRILSEAGRIRSLKRRRKGAARHLCYPEHTVYETLGRRVLEADFIGRKYLAGSSEPLHFVGFSFKKPPRLRYFQRVRSQTAAEIISASEAFFQAFEYPDVMKVDNAQATVGTGSGKRCLSRFMVFLLERQILPVYSVPRKPFSQASIEGNNSVFSRKFWNSRHFASVEEVDTQLQWFNDDSIAYTGYEVRKPKWRSSKKGFVPKVYFIRQVKEAPQENQGAIHVLNEVIPLPESYIHYFVLAEWDLTKERLNILFEQEKQATVIESVDFPLNPNSRFRLN